MRSPLLHCSTLKNQLMRSYSRSTGKHIVISASKSFLWFLFPAPHALFPRSAPFVVNIKQEETVI